MKKSAEGLGDRVTKVLRFYIKKIRKCKVEEKEIIKGFDIRLSKNLSN